MKQSLRARALLFDLNGTMINDMPYHVDAWLRILNELGAGISRERTKQECYGKNQELLERIFPGRFSVTEKETISAEKEKQYQREFAPQLRLIDGLGDFIHEASEAGIKLAIGSAAILSNINFVVDGLGLRKYFDVIVSAEDVKNSKPDPETWYQCMQRMGVEAKDCIVFEDAPAGVLSAENAGIPTVVITTMHHPEEFKDNKNVTGFIKDFKKLSIEMSDT